MDFPIDIKEEKPNLHSLVGAVVLSEVGRSAGAGATTVRGVSPVEAVFFAVGGGVAVAISQPGVGVDEVLDVSGNRPTLHPLRDPLRLVEGSEGPLRTLFDSLDPSQNVRDGLDPLRNLEGAHKSPTPVEYLPQNFTAMVFSCLACKTGFSAPQYLHQHEQRCARRREHAARVEEAKSRGCRKCAEGGTAGSRRCAECSLRFACNLCPKTYTTRTALVMHKRFHSLEKTYVCGRCPAMFFEEGELTSHEATHVGGGVDDDGGGPGPKRSHRCDGCARRFARKADLAKHVRSHALACPECNATFATGDDLKVHRRSHALRNMHVCGTCKERFSRIGDLRRHEPVHAVDRPYACDVCDRRFTQSGSLTTHRRTHDGVRPYACRVCTASFVQTSALKRHLLTHGGRRPFACSGCHATFVTNTSLLQHRATCDPTPSAGHPSPAGRGRALEKQPTPSWA